MKIYTVDEADGWNRYVKSFPNWDVYYLCKYAASLSLHGDGIPSLICYEDTASRMCYVVMKRDISDDVRFQKHIEKDELFDWETPYGYGGPLVDGEFTVSSQQAFCNELSEYCNRESIVSQFVRYHPLLNNHNEFSMITESRYLHDTIFMDTSSADIIFSNMNSKNRNMVRKAKNAGVQVIKRPIDDYKIFFEMYFEAMRQHNAGDYYIFNERYFEYIRDELQENAAVFYAMLKGKPVGGAVFLLGEKAMHYHLAAMPCEYRNLAAGNLLVFEAALWACEHGIKVMHLGGGLKENDSLFGFKKQFNKNGRLPFYIGRTVFKKPAYDYLLQIRKQWEPEFDADNDFLIQYRR